MSTGGSRVMKYPYTVSGKLALFPYRWHWKNGRFVRFLGFTLLGVFPLICKIHSAVHSPGNVRQWEDIRKKREHTHFDPVH
ncbi:uncharacterized protein LOC143296126 [Babylonia areolata]|uniref:uncharacterized protein LOC143296126 n=1 Tax=Babylonia areolata TaxID=304850 RepID=UPI003FD47786